MGEDPGEMEGEPGEGRNPGEVGGNQGEGDWRDIQERWGKVMVEFREDWGETGEGDGGI